MAFPRLRGIILRVAAAKVEWNEENKLSKVESILHTKMKKFNFICSCCGFLKVELKYNE